jgi:hypothetical protein
MNTPAFRGDVSFCASITPTALVLKRILLAPSLSIQLGSASAKSLDIAFAKNKHSVSKIHILKKKAFSYNYLKQLLSDSSPPQSSNLCL